MMAVSFVLLLSACADPPHVHDPVAFNRAHPDFGKTRTDIKEVSICYNSLSTTPAIIASLARESCGEFAKTPVFVAHDYTICPLNKPVAARFICVADQATSDNDDLRF